MKHILGAGSLALHADPLAAFPPSQDRLPATCSTSLPRPWWGHWKDRGYEHVPSVLSGALGSHKGLHSP